MLFPLLALQLGMANAQTLRTIQVDPIDDSEPEVGCSLREAIEVANAGQISGLGCESMDAGGGFPVSFVLQLPAYTYTITGERLDDANIEGDLDVLGTLTISGMGMDETIIDGDRRDRLFHVLNSAANLTLENLTVRNGSAGAEAEAAERQGGGVLVEFGVLSVLNVRFEQNLATGNNNRAGNGGAIGNISGIMTISSSEFLGNQSNNRGGAINTQGDGRVNNTQVDIESTLFENNVSPTGGALFAGGLQGAANLDRVIMRGNRSSRSGGAISTLFGAGQTDTNIVNCIFSDNESGDDGGAISGINFNIANTSIFNNRADDSGGGLSVRTSTLSHVTVYSNIADADGSGQGSGGGVSSISGLTIKNSVVAANSAADGLDCAGAVVSEGFNLVGANDGCSIEFPGGAPNINQDFVGSAGLPIDPQIVEVAPDQALVLTQPSIARDRIPATDCVYISRGFNPFYADGETVVLDQVGTTRDSLCDIGAFEYAVDITNINQLVTSEAGLTTSTNIALLRQPAQDVEIPVTTTSAEISVSASSLVFTSADWDQPQLLEITGQDDDVDDGDQEWTVVLAPALSNDPVFAGIDAPDLSGTNVDDDTAGLAVTPDALIVVAENGTKDTIQVALTSEPLDEVLIEVVSSNEAEGIVDLAQLFFTPLSWNVPQTVTVTGIDDGILDPDTPFQLTLTATSNDALYQTLEPITVQLLNRAEQLFLSGFEGP